MKQKWVDAFMDTAERFAQLSSSRRLHVGAVVVKDNRIISIGYNGMPSGWDNNCEDEIREESEYIIDMGGPTHTMGTIRWKTKPEVLHAESNAIAKLAKSTESGDGASMFITCSPCIECAKMIFQSGIKEVFYSENYSDDAGVVFLNKCGITVKQI